MLRALFFMLAIKPLVLIGLGLNVRRRELLPRCGPAILVANHASHLDALVLMSLYPMHQLKRVRPMAAIDYFLSRRWLAWCALNLIGILPLSRRPKVSEGDPLAQAVQFLQQGGIAILFPEGTRTLSGEMGELKSGVAHLVRRCPEAKVTPILIKGLDLALPKGEALLVPYSCDLFVGEALAWGGDKQQFMTQLAGAFEALDRRA
jgi:1-acyl-sn-glycerol-3-phosphate acyltransferase